MSVSLRNVKFAYECASNVPAVTCFEEGRDNEREHERYLTYDIRREFYMLAIPLVGVYLSIFSVPAEKGE
jgi:hypothetical protein